MAEMFKLERNIELYRSEFEKFTQEYFGDYRLDRYSLELDAVLFRMKYMELRDLITDEDIPKLRDEFTEKAIKLRTAFGELMLQFIMEFLKIPVKFKISDIEDLLVMDVKMDPIYVHFRLIVVSTNEEFLQAIDNAIPVDTFNMYPNEYFRFHTDSYNDGIAKAYPELFEEKHKDVGKGDDGDVFVHSFTFQVTEDCSYQCFSADTLITMADGTLKPISEIEVGDMILGCDESVLSPTDSDFHPSKVLKTFHQKAEAIKCMMDYDNEYLFGVTPDHPFLSMHGDWRPFYEILINANDGFVSHDLECEKKTEVAESYLFTTDNRREEMDVYNLETECHTYLALGLVVHNCSYCFSGETKIRMADGSQKPIKEIQVGDEVLSWRGGVIVPTVVTNKFISSRSTVELHRGNVVTRVTPDHPFLIKEHGWMNVFEILHNDYVKSEGLHYTVYEEDREYPIQHLSVDSVDIVFSGAMETVYNFETETHTYIADDYVVHNCYQTHKTPMHMEFSTAKKFIDHLLNDDYSYINRYNSPAIILEFIGGEPFLQTKLIRQIYDYFLDRCYELNHPWFTLHRVSICSNGSHYFTEDVQNLFKDYSSQISFNISIDGNKALHDSCRVDKEGKGTYDRCMKALNHFNAHYSPERNSKMTLAPQNISYLYDSVVDFIKNGMKVININCVFEEGWTAETARIEYFQLCKISDYLLENDLENIYIAIFNERQEGPYDKSFNGTSCGGNGSMLAMRPNGQFYPCLRYMPSSVGSKVKDLCIGDVDNGLIGRTDNSEVLQLLDSITRRSQNNDICYECPIANDCPSCLAHGHTVFGTPDKRATFICIQVIAEALANVYHWNRMVLKHPEWDLEPRKNVVPDEWSSIILDEKELKDLKELEGKAFLVKKE